MIDMPDERTMVFLYGELALEKRVLEEQLAAATLRLAELERELAEERGEGGEATAG